MSSAKKYLYLVNEYSQSEWDIYYSLLLEGKDVTVSSLHYDGFITDISSPIKDMIGEDKSNGSPLRLVDFKIPDYWDIVTNDGEVSLYDLHFKRASVKFEGNFSDRIVREVSWLSNKGDLERVDYYNSKGFIYKIDTYSVVSSQLISTRYFDYEGNLVLDHNYETDCVSTKDGVFFSYIDFMVNYYEAYSDYSLITSSRTSLIESIEERIFLDKGASSNIFIYTSERVSSIPSSIKELLDNKKHKVIVTKRPTFRLLCEKYDIYYSGVSVPIRESNNNGSDVLIATLSDNIVDIDLLLENCPKSKFHILAPTLMSDKLKDLKSRYSNVILYEAASKETLKKLVASCGILLDIAVSMEVYNVNRLAVEYNMLRLGLMSVSDMSYMSRDFVFQEVSDMFNIINGCAKYSDFLKTSVNKENTEIGVNYSVNFSRLLD